MARYNADHPDHPIELGSVSGSNNDAEPDDEEAFNILAPQFQEDPYSEDDDVVVGDGGGGESPGGDDDDEEEDESDKDEGEGDVGGD